MFLAFLIPLELYFFLIQLIKSVRQCVGSYFFETIVHPIEGYTLELN